MSASEALGRQFDLPIDMMYSTDHNSMVHPAMLHDVHEEEQEAVEGKHGSEHYHPYDDLVETAKRGDFLNRVRVVPHPEHGMALDDGHHRFSAAWAAGRKTIRAEWAKK